MWLDALALADHDFYHLPGYVEVCAREAGESQPLAFVFDEGAHVMLIPLLRRDIPGSAYADSASPYGYSSPVFSRGAGDAFQVRALAAFVTEGAAAGLVTSFVRLHPLLQPTIPAGDGVRPVEGGNWSVYTHGPTVALDTLKPDDAWLARVSTNHRRNIRRLRRDGFTVRFDEQADAEAFRALYAETMGRVGSAAAYFFSDAYFDGLAEALGSLLCTADVVAPDGRVAAAGLFVRTGAIAEYHLGGTAEAFLSLGPSKLLFADVREEMGKRGAAVLHLGGGLGSRRDSLFAFKAAFAGTEHTFRSLRVVHDAQRYADEIRTAAAPGAAVLEDDGFFPAYRRMT